MSRTKLLKFASFIFLAAILFSVPVITNAQSKKDRKAAQRLVRDADTLYRQRDYSGAIEKYAEALVLVPKYPYAHLSKAFSHLRLNQNDLALNDLTAALNQGHSPLEVYRVRWEVYFEKGDLEAALADVKAAQKLAPDDTSYHVAEGRILNKRGKYLEALEKFDRAINLGTNDGNVYYYKANSYHKTGDYAQQESSARKALASGAKCAGECWFLIGDHLQRQRKYQDAVTAYQTSIASSDGIRDSYYNLAETHRLRNEFSKAVKIARAGSQRFPDDAGLKVALIRYYSLDGNNGFAVKVGEEAIGLLPNNATAYKNLCRALSYQGQYYYDRKAQSMADKSFDKAIQHCTRALKLKPDDGESQYYLGRTYQLKGNSALSESFYKKSITGLLEFTDNNPDDADGFHILGNAYFTTVQYKKAIDAYEKCLKISPRFAEVMFNLGYAYHLSNNRPKALEQVLKLEKIDPVRAEKLRKVIDGN
ncbi:MAG: tetratricopeptide repeat protein [Pyrinomonadaceae bacterium]|nr:tetratricopeptide repeat protein [Pyrinomonadaceae bacterium]